MKKQILTAVILSSLSISAFALPQNNPQPLLGEMQDSSVKTLMGFGSNLQTEGGAERTGANRVAEGGANRLQERLRVAEDGADRTGANRVAEGGADRLQERLRVAEDGADRTGANRVAEGGAERTPGLRFS